MPIMTVSITPDWGLWIWWSSTSSSPVSYLFQSFIDQPMKQNIYLKCFLFLFTFFFFFCSHSARFLTLLPEDCKLDYRGKRKRICSWCFVIGYKWSKIMCITVCIVRCCFYRWGFYSLEWFRSWFSPSSFFFLLSLSLSLILFLFFPPFFQQSDSMHCEWLSPWCKRWRHSETLYT